MNEDSNQPPTESRPSGILGWLKNKTVAGVTGLVLAFGALGVAVVAWRPWENNDTQQGKPPAGQTLMDKSELGQVAAGQRRVKAFLDQAITWDVSNDPDDKLLPSDLPASAVGIVPLDNGNVRGIAVVVEPTLPDEQKSDKNFRHNHVLRVTFTSDDDPNGLWQDNRRTAVAKPFDSVIFIGPDNLEYEAFLFQTDVVEGVRGRGIKAILETVPKTEPTGFPSSFMITDQTLVPTKGEKFKVTGYPTQER